MPAHDLRAENAYLRQMLKSADEIAARTSTMLREGNHRIKNSLQIVASLMTMQASREATLSASQALRTAAARILSVARMHDALQESEGEDSVNLAVILETMCASLHDMGGDALGVDVRVEAEAVRAPVVVAQPLVLAVNELVVNALRHAFPDGRTGSVVVSLRCIGGQLHVLVADDGVGLPAGHADGQGYGMKLVRMMTTQVNGVLQVDSGAGTRINIVLPEPQLAAATQPSLELVTPPNRAAKSARVRELLTPLLRKPWKADGRG
ncbi:MAG: sensor histidine kinase [Hyphomonadaceae bacterium]|nr:sensor histidine kinase [Hyphomonadaceae bacterium]